LVPLTTPELGGGVVVVADPLVGVLGVLDCAMALPADAVSIAMVRARVILRVAFLNIVKSPLQRVSALGRRLESQKTNSDRLAASVA
jgi:hypothetical protein